MDFSMPVELVALLGELDQFLESEIVPLQQQDDNERFFDHRREVARTDVEAGGLPRPERREPVTNLSRRDDFRAAQ